MWLLTHIGRVCLLCCCSIACNPLEATPAPFAAPQTSPGGEVVIEGLTSGRKYICSVTASNGKGDGEAATVEVTPR